MRGLHWEVPFISLSHFSSSWFCTFIHDKWSVYTGYKNSNMLWLVVTDVIIVFLDTNLLKYPRSLLKLLHVAAESSHLHHALVSSTTHTQHMITTWQPHDFHQLRHDICTLPYRIFTTMEVRRLLVVGDGIVVLLQFVLINLCHACVVSSSKTEATLK